MTLGFSLGIASSRFVVVAATLAFALIACSVAPVKVPDGDVPTAWRNVAADDPALGPAPDLRSWWRAFHDDDLNALVDEALAGNLTLTQATYRIAAARALSARASVAYFPEVGAHTFAEPTPDSSASYFQAGFDAKWEFGLFGRAASSARIAEADIRLAEIDAQSARVTVVAEVARVYIELRGAEHRLALLSRLADSAQATSVLIATRERLRLASAMESASSEAERAAAEAALIEPTVAIDRGHQQLAVLLGKSERAAQGLPSGEMPTLQASRIDTAPADLLRTRPEIRRAEFAILKAAGELGVARSDLFPRLALGGSLTYSARVIGHTRLADADGIATFGPLIDIPIFDWGARRAVVNAREAELQATLAGYRQAVLEGVADVESAMTTLQHARERVEDLQNAATARARSDAASATLRRLGLADEVDREMSNATLLKAQLDVAEAEQARDLAFIALYKAFGGAPLLAKDAG